MPPAPALDDAVNRTQRPARTASLPLAALLGEGTLLEAALVALTLLSYRIPDTFGNIYGYSPITRSFFAHGWGLSPPPALSVESFRNWFGGLWLLLNGLWLGAFALARQVRKTGRVAALLTLGLLLHLTLALAMPPVLSTDIYNYLAYGRMVAWHGLNPYTTLPSQLPGDPLQAFPMWDIVTHYGPVWIGLSAAVAWLAGPEGIFSALLMFKVLAALAHLAIAVLAYKLARGWQVGTPLAGAVLLGACPLLLLEGAGNGHNDLVMMALALGGLLAFQRKRPWLGYVLLLLSVMVKYVSALLVLFYLAAWLREQEGYRARLRLLGLAAAMGLLVFVVGYGPFWEGPAALLAGLGEESTHFLLSPAAYLRGPLERLWSAAAPAPGQARQLALVTLNALQKVGLLLLLFFCLRWVWRSPGDPLPRITAAWGVAALVYIGLLHNAIFPWYWTWPLATAGAEWFRPVQRRVALFSGSLGTLAALLYGIPL